MKKQGVARHLTTPRTLLFLQREQKWLFIKGAAHKWWAGKLNGIGGSVEAGEDILSAALRETKEETGLYPTQLDLAAIIHIMVEPAVLLFVFVGCLPNGDILPCAEGTFHWLSRKEFAEELQPLMPDLPFLLPYLWQWQPTDGPRYFLYDFSQGFTVDEGLLIK